MKLVFGDARVWRYVITAISKIIEEAAFKATEDGLRLRAMDASHVVLVDFHLPRESLIEYEVEGEEDIGVNMEDLAKILRRATKGDTLRLETLEGSRLAVIFVGRGTRKFIIPSLEIRAEEIPSLKLEFTAKAGMLSSIFRDVVKELEPIGDSIEFHTSPDMDKLIARSSGDLAEAEIELSRDVALTMLEASEEARAMYTIDYLSDIVSAAQAAQETILEFGTGIPCKIEYILPENGRLVFYVAPRVE